MPPGAISDGQLPGGQPGFLILRPLVAPIGGPGAYASFNLLCPGEAMKGAGALLSQRTTLAISKNRCKPTLD